MTQAEPKRLLFVGLVEDEGGQTATQRMWALRELGCRVEPLSTLRPVSFLRRAARSARRRILKRTGDRGLHREILEALARQPFDGIWIDKVLELMPETLEEARRRWPHLRIVGYSPDDMMNPDNHPREYPRTLPWYDIYFTTKSYNVAELQALGCRRVVFVGNAFHPTIHRPVAVTEEERRRLGGPVGFIGGAERERATSLARLAAAGVPVRVWGDEWPAWKRRLGASFEVAGESLFGPDYAKLICAFDVNLCFLRKVNRDLQTTRSIEIPACGAFMLAERTDEHRALFEEGREAEFFSSDEELIDKTRFYLDRPDLRRAIAAAGRERCLRSGYSYLERMRSMLEAAFPA